MQVIIREEENRKETQVFIYCRKADEKIRKIENFIKRMSFTMNVTSNDRIYRIRADDILYMESVDRRTFLYTLEKVYETKEPLYQLENQLRGTGITRISKNCLLNVDSLQHIAPFTNHRFEATLVNGEKILVSRTYINDLKKKLEG